MRTTLLSIQKLWILPTECKPIYVVLTVFLERYEPVGLCIWNAVCFSARQEPTFYRPNSEVNFVIQRESSVIQQWKAIFWVASINYNESTIFKKSVDTYTCMTSCRSFIYCRQFNAARAAVRGFGPWWIFFVSLPNKGRLAKNLYTNLERLTLAWAGPSGRAV